LTGGVAFGAWCPYDRLVRRTIGHRLFKLGQIPKRRREALKAEGIRVLDEGIPVAITYRNYRAPGRFYAWRRSYGSGSVVVTGCRLFISYYRWPVFDLGLEDPRFGRIHLTSPTTDSLQISFEAADLFLDRTGSVAIRIRSDEAATVLSYLRLR